MVTQIQEVKITDIKPNEDNPRYITDANFDRLVNSITNFPKMLQKRPIIVDENMVVLGGNMRLKACAAAGLKKVPILIAKGWTEEEKKEFLIKDNISYGKWDWETLGDNWNNEDLKQWDMKFLTETKKTIETNNIRVTIVGVDSSDREEVKTKIESLGYKVK